MNLFQESLSCNKQSLSTALCPSPTRLFYQYCHALTRQSTNQSHSTAPGHFLQHCHALICLPPPPPPSTVMHHFLTQAGCWGSAKGSVKHRLSNFFFYTIYNTHTLYKSSLPRLLSNTNTAANLYKPVMTTEGYHVF